MHKLIFNPLLVVAGLLLTGSAFGQERAGTSSMGAVRGRVICGDSNAPARMAKVRLEAVKTELEPAAHRTGKVEAFSGGAEGTTVETNLNGEFLFPRVRPGAYFVIVEKAGYLSVRASFTAKEMEDKSPEMQEILARRLNRVQVEPGHTEQVQIREERGGAVSGTVLFDDGSPASGLAVQVLKKQTSGKWEELRVISGNASPDSYTDDQGRFRIASLPADTYMIKVDMSIQDVKTVVVSDPGSDNHTEYAVLSYRDTLPFYGRGATRLAEAASFTLGAAQELTGADVTIPLTKLHRLTGIVVAMRDGHKVSAAKVILTYRDDGKELTSTELSKEDGTFSFEFVPEGDYIMQTKDSRDVVREQVKNVPGAFPPVLEKERLLSAFGDANQPLLLQGEVSDIVLQVPEKGAAKVADAKTGRVERSEP